MNFLGDTIPQIAFEKAGILKQGRPAVIGRQPEAASAVIRQRADTLEVPLFRYGIEWDAEPMGSGWCFSDMRTRVDLPLPALPGRHQIDNAGAVVCCLRLLEGFVVDRDAIVLGMQDVTWPGRLQRLDSGPLLANFGIGWELWLDGGHNPGAAEVLAETFAGWTDKPLYLVLGMLSNRDPADFVAPLAPHLAGIETVTIPGEANSYSAEACAALLDLPDTDVHAAHSVEEAVAAIYRRATDRAGRIVICGSLYLVGHVLASHAPPT